MVYPERGALGWHTVFRLDTGWRWTAVRGGGWRPWAQFEVLGPVMRRDPGFGMRCRGEGEAQASGVRLCFAWGSGGRCHRQDACGTLGTRREWGIGR